MLTNGIFWHKKFIVGTSPPPPSPSLLMLAAASPAPWSSSAPSPWASPPISLMSTPISQHHHCHLHLQAAQHVGLLHLLLPFPPMLLEAPGILAGGMGSVWFIWNIKYYLAPDLGPVPHPLCVCVSAVDGLCMHIPNQPLHMILLLLPCSLFSFLLHFSAFLQLSSQGAGPADNLDHYL